MTAQTLEKPAKTAMNGVDVPAFLATLGVVGETPQIAHFTFRADGEWLSGTHSRTAFTGFHGAMQDMQHRRGYAVECDHPQVLCGADNGVTPVELLLAALASCITAGIGNIASIRQVKLDAVETRIEGDIDLNGILGLDKTARNGFSGIRMAVTIRGDAPQDKLREIVEQSVARSAVFDVLGNGVPVSVEMAA
ncbi:OsmC family protein [Mangrovicoccus ximenensis]|uniref:OsmC family protein n=1 Tax=Mangrovicoccus ximenensis TaxID=1911570 RepID=UPI000D37BD52|nr:OsmC family protein [Mangrovicoccus ximenensis]